MLHSLRILLYLHEICLAKLTCEGIRHGSRPRKANHAQMRPGDTSALLSLEICWSRAGEGSVVRVVAVAGTWPEHAGRRRTRTTQLPSPSHPRLSRSPPADAYHSDPAVFSPATCRSTSIGTTRSNPLTLYARTRVRSLATSNWTLIGYTRAQLLFPRR